MDRKDGFVSNYDDKGSQDDRLLSEIPDDFESNYNEDLIKKRVDDFFQMIVSNKDKEKNYYLFFSGVHIVSDLEFNLAKEAGTVSPLENDNNAVTLEFKRAVQLFFDTLFLKLETYIETATVDEVNETVAALEKALFSTSSALLDTLSPEEFFSLGAKLERVPQAVSNIGARVSEKLEYALYNYSEAQIDELAENILNKSAVNQLQYIGVCYNTLRTAVVGGSKTQDHTKGLLTVLLTKLSEKSAYPLARYYANSILEVNKGKEKELGIVQFDKKVKHFGNEQLALDVKGRANKNGVLQTFTRDGASEELTGYAFFSDPALLPFASANTVRDEVLSFEKLHEPLLKQFIEKKFSIILAEIPVRVQLHFLRFLVEQDEGIMDRLAEVLHTKPKLKQIDFLKSFFACADSISKGEEILKFAESRSSEDNKLFSVFGKIVDQLDSVKEETSKFFADEHKSVDAKAVVQETHKRASKILFESMTVLPNEHNSQLDSIEADSMLFASIFKTATKEHGNLTFSEIQGFDVRRVSGTQLAEKEKEEMLKIFTKNYASEPEFIDRFKSFLNPNTEQGNNLLAKNEFTVIKQRNGKDGESKIVAFFRLQDNENEFYFAANNVDPAWQSSGMGRASVKNIITEASKIKPVTATFPPNTEIGPFYISELGFIGTGVKMEMEKYPRFVISLSERNLNSLLRGKSTVELTNYLLPSKSSVQEIIDQQKTPIVLSFTLPTDSNKAYAANELLTKHGYSFTSYSIVDQKTNTRWYGFEKLV